LTAATGRIYFGNREIRRDLRKDCGGAGDFVLIDVGKIQFASDAVHMQDFFDETALRGVREPARKPPWEDMA
jgi:hypothetical protein